MTPFTGFCKKKAAALSGMDPERAAGMMDASVEAFGSAGEMRDRRRVAEYQDSGEQ
jgi:expansin (peptidoglycan-binding protein)